MDLDPGLAIALSVVLHVIWNLLARRSPDAGAFLWWGIAGHVLWSWPVLVVLLGPGAWPAGLGWWLACSSAAIVGYFLCLGRAYQRAPAGVVYPLARSSPVPIAVAAGLCFGHWPSALGWTGIAVSVGGLLLLSRSAGGWRGPGVAWALGAAAATTVYALSDREAARLLSATAGVEGALAFVTLIYFISLPLLAGERRLRGLRALPPRPPLAIWISGSLCIGSAYALVIHALRRIPPAEAVAFTNAGIALVVVLGMLWLRERTHIASRLVAVTLIVSGLALLGWSRAG